jgi:3-isopropylmalate/(R)-2-methylmalate dehydratase small subunit
MNTTQKGRLRGRCYKLGDNVPLDNAIMPVRFAVTHEFDLAVLMPHLFTDLIPKFGERAKPGDIIVAGKSFCAGKAHPQGLIAMAALGVGILCESMPFNAYRGAVSRGIHVNRNCEGISGLVEDGDEIEMDYASGRFINHTRKAQHDYPSIEPGLLGIMTGGGMHGMLRQWRDQQPQS